MDLSAAVEKRRSRVTRTEEGAEVVPLISDLYLITAVLLEHLFASVIKTYWVFALPVYRFMELTVIDRSILKYTTTQAYHMLIRHCYGVAKCSVELIIFQCRTCIVYYC